jgi:murein DD-endopeptidase MepM/ murein hydrolase activator NlpD
MIDPDFFRRGLLHKSPRVNANFLAPILRDTQKTTTIESVGAPAKAAVSKNKWVNFGANNGYSSLKKNDAISIGGTKLYITDPYGIRNFKGREGEHSTGIDFKTSTGKAVAIKDGEIIDAKLQGSGAATGTEKKSAGYWVKVKHTDGSYGQYMHLDPMDDNQMKGLIGKKLKRGDEIWGYSQGSGSMTGKHVKFRLYGQDPRVNIDPSQAFRGENYDFIPGLNGENILSQSTDPQQ